MNFALKNLRLWIVAASAGLLIAGPMLISSIRADDDAPPATQPASRPAGMSRVRQGNGGGRNLIGTSLEGDMSAMNTAFNTLKKQISDPTQNDSSIVLLGQIEAGAAMSKGIVPDSIKSMPADDQKKAIQDYQEMFRTIIHDCLDAEDQLNAGDNAKAAATLDSIAEIEKAGHQEYRKPNGRG